MVSERVITINVHHVKQRGQILWLKGSLLGRICKLKNKVSYRIVVDVMFVLIHYCYRPILCSTVDILVVELLLGFQQQPLT